MKKITLNGVPINRTTDALQ